MTRGWIWIIEYDHPDSAEKKLNLSQLLLIRLYGNNMETKKVVPFFKPAKREYSSCSQVQVLDTKITSHALMICGAEPEARASRQTFPLWRFMMMVSVVMG
jgi:hypothetical protein